MTDKKAEPKHSGKNSKVIADDKGKNKTNDKRQAFTRKEKVD